MVENAMKRNPRENHRTTFHHIGMFDAAQAERVAKMKIEASANPYYLWALADKYSETGLGPDRAANLVPMKELTKRGIPMSLHSDFAMAPAEPLLLAWVAVNRIVASGKVMNPEQKISVYDAMKGVTITAARTFEMEHEIGSIKKGKQATFTLLEQNPFKIDPVKIKDIPVAGIVYKGRIILNKRKLTGADRDEHGCIGSAGYSWCASTNQCERPWELAKKNSFENNQEAFDKFCENPAN
jgi:predicted amidohydrolase YtcJ